MIHEIITTSLNADDSIHIAPMGIRHEAGLVVIAPFKPSTTLENIQRNQTVTVNMTDNVQIFAGCLTGRYDWQTYPTEKIRGLYLEQALTHQELTVVRYEDDDVRPRFYCEITHQVIHQPFNGFNRAQAAVLELAILVSRLHMLPNDKIQNEIEYLTIAIDKTAGENEKQAWDWLMQKVHEHHSSTGEKA